MIRSQQEVRVRALSERDQSVSRMRFCSCLACSSCLLLDAWLVSKFISILCLLSVGGESSLLDCWVLFCFVILYFRCSRLYVCYNSIFCWNFQIPAPLPTPICLCAGNVCATPLKNLGNFKRFNTIPNSEILLNLIRKMKYSTDRFQLRFCFCIGNAK